jgi:uncharacterized protein
MTTKSTSLNFPGVKIEPGRFTRASVPCAYLPDSSVVSIPLSILAGQNDGPTLWVSAAMHGTEITGTEVIRRLLRESLDPTKLRGIVVASPILSPLAYNSHQMNTPQDGYNLNRVFPGDPKMLLSHRLANLIYTKLVKPCDYVIDLHANPSPAMQFSIVKEGADPSVNKKSRELAAAFGITTIEMLYEHEKHRTGTMTSCAMDDGKPSLVLELVYWRRIDEVSVQTGVRGLLNVMKKIGMIDGAIEEQKDTLVIKGPLSRIELTANKGGLVFWHKTAGEKVRAREKIGIVRDPWGDVVEEVRSPVDGWVLAWPLLGNQAVATGDILTFIAFERK